jgi:large subunit ribosomal protein L17
MALEVPFIVYMRKQVFGRQFKRDKNERKALFQGLISAVILRGRISTTEEKAKSIKGDLEKLVTKAKKGEEARVQLRKTLKPFETDKMINVIGPAFKDRNGGYTRIVKTGRRFNDNASTAILEWVEEIKVVAPVVADKATKKPAKATEKKEAKADVKKPAAKKPAKTAKKETK